MNKKYILITIVIVLLLGIVFWLISKNINSKNSLLTSPGLGKVSGEQISPTPTQSPTPPKTYSFDSATDLKSELENINPQVLESDFQGL